MLLTNGYNLCVYGRPSLNNVSLTEGKTGNTTITEIDILLSALTP